MDILYDETSTNPQILTFSFQTVVPEYNAMVAELESGLSVALELAKDNGCQSEFRTFCGPAGEIDK